MKDPPSPSSFPDRQRLVVDELRFGQNGPYSFTCSAGECITITGESGVGKTLLLRALADLDPHSGGIMLDGKSWADHTPPDWRRRLALVPAEPRWWYEDVGAHLPADYDPQEARELVESCGFEADVLKWQVSRLSTGEKQRLALVRALIRKPDVLLLDETGSGLDQKNGLLLEQRIRLYQSEHQAPILWVSHAREQVERVGDRSMALFKDHAEFSTGRQQEMERP